LEPQWRIGLPLSPQLTKRSTFLVNIFALQTIDQRSKYLYRLL
jgi:hypothetical protein